MDPTSLVGPSNPLGYPAPYWFLVLFKVLGFTLHMVPMSLWYTGIALALLARWRGGEGARLLSDRLMRQMPTLVALGVNFGIVPLLFIQVAYYKVFYPATILMAWPWLSIIVLLTVAYYCVYIYVIGLRRGRLTPLKQGAGWAAALLFLGMGFLFSNGMSLMTNLGAWPELWQRTSVAGAPMGGALNTGDPTLWPRWLMGLGLALTTTAAYIFVDAGFFAVRENEGYRRWAAGFAFKVYTVGLVWFAMTGLWYAFGAWPAEVRRVMFSGHHAALTGLTAVGPGLPWLLMLFQRRGTTRAMALATGVAQFAALGLNAVSRQIVQNIELSRFVDVTAERVNTQWSTLVLFLMVFVAGLGIIVWMVRQVMAAGRQPVSFN